MVFQKRLEYVSNGYQIPAIPRVPRSAKGKRSARKKVEDNQMCAFDLLANLAGKLLAERACKTAGVTSSVHAYNMKETLKCGGFDQESKMQFIEVPGPTYADHPRARIPSAIDGMESHADRDDGENSSGCSYPRSKFFKPHYTGENSIRNMVMSNYRKEDPGSYDDGQVSNDDGETKADFRKQKLFCQRTPRMFERCSISASRGDEDSQVKDGGIRLEASHLLAALNGANNISWTRRSHNLSYESADYPVKLSIKSFRVPELFIEIPSNATVGSLKRTVMEAVMAILGDGLRVGVLLQGKKVRDDNKTLRQAGIFHEHNKMDSLGFTLEPKPPQNRPEVPPCCLPCESTPLKNKLHAATNCSESDHDNTVHSPPIYPCSYSAAAESKAMIPMAAANAEALSVVPLRRFRRSDIIQRRIRRPFSVSEVEALVQAVEKLGTGRWRDVKLRAFDNAKHRTYVDLKDKWKTLVHTARISPQQRRGEPVPQELLDRVLLAHAYWSQQQPRLPGPATGFIHDSFQRRP